MHEEAKLIFRRGGAVEVNFCCGGALQGSAARFTFLLLVFFPRGENLLVSLLGIAQLTPDFPN